MINLITAHICQSSLNCRGGVKNRKMENQLLKNKVDEKKQPSITQFFK